MFLVVLGVADLNSLESRLPARGNMDSSTNILRAKMKLLLARPSSSSSSSSSSSFLLYYMYMALIIVTTRAFRPASFLPVFVRATTTTTTTTTTAVAASSSTMIAINPLLQQEDLPKFASIQPSDLTPAVETLLEKLEKDFVEMEDTLTKNIAADASSSSCLDYDQVLPVIEKMQFPIGYVWGVAGHLNGVKNGDELRQAYQQNEPKIVQAFSKFSQSKPLYEALLKLNSTTTTTTISPPPPTNRHDEEEVEEEDDSYFARQQKQRAVEISLRSMKLGGVGLNGADQTRFNEIRMKLASLATSFSNNVLDETKAFSLIVEPKEALTKLAKVPESAKAMWANAHESDDATPEHGPYKITLDMPSYIAVLSHVGDRDLRRHVYMANIQRASEKNPDKNNIPLIMEILNLRMEMAKLLGFDNYAELSLASKMADSIDSVRELSELILQHALPAAERELAEITQLAHDNGHPPGEPLMPWDTTYWSERLKESKYNLTEEETRPYFALPVVLEGMFALVDRLFQIKVQAADGEAEVWHPDVRFFKVYDRDNNNNGKHIASFFLDPYSRPADKRGGAWMDVCIGKSQAVQREIPVAYLTCNGSPPVGEKPSLMTFREVETLFHEFGHGLQHMLTKASVGDVAGINGIEWDAVELPSQFMENWCYDRPTLFGIAKHWQTGESMPEEMFAKLKAQKTFNAGLMSCRQLLFGQVDMELHSSFVLDPTNRSSSSSSGSTETVFDVHRRMAQIYTPYALPIPEDRFLCTFTHIFAGGYAAGYYSYKWAEIMAADAFSAFEEVGLDDDNNNNTMNTNEDAIRRVGRKFRDTVLSLGGGVSPKVVFERFRGRSPQPDALLRHSGLVVV